MEQFHSDTDVTGAMLTALTGGSWDFFYHGLQLWCAAEQLERRTNVSAVERRRSLSL